MNKFIFFKKSFLVAVLAIILIYQAFSSFYSNDKILPPIRSILTTSYKEIGLINPNNSKASYLNATSTILINFFYTVSRIIVSLFIGIPLGIAYGVLIHYFKRFTFGNKVVLFFLKNIPLFSLIPLFLLWFGGSEVGIILYIAFAIFTIFAITTYEAIIHVPQEYLKLCKVLSTPKFLIFKDVVIFAILPELFATLYNIVGIVWAFSLGGELLGTTKGLGYLVYFSFIYGSMGKLYILISCYVILGVSTTTLIKKARKHIFKWL